MQTPGKKGLLVQCSGQHIVRCYICMMGVYVCAMYSKSQERAGERFCLQNWPYKNWSQEKKSIPKSTRFTRSFIEWASGHTQLNIYPQKVSIMTVYFAARWDTWKQPCLYNDSRPEKTTHKRLFLFWLYIYISSNSSTEPKSAFIQWISMDAEV